MATFPKTRSRVVAWLSRRHAGQDLHEWAWVEFTRDYEPPIRRLCLRLGLSESEIDDILQDVWVKIRDNVDTFRGRSRFRTWVSSLTTNVVTDYFRKRMAEAKVLATFAEEVAVEPIQADSSAEVENRHDRPIDLLRAIERLENLATQFHKRGTIEAYYLNAILGCCLKETVQTLASLGYGMSKAGVCEAVERVNKKLCP
jgi:RNA polymerase sigma factor (sigma-70 family)